MFGIILSGHGGFATGLLSAYNLLNGNTENIVAVDFLPDENEDELREHLNVAVKKLEQYGEIVFLTDILGGSPFKNAVLLNQENTQNTVFYGINLAMLIECGMTSLTENSERENRNEKESRWIDLGREMIGKFE